MAASILAATLLCAFNAYRIYARNEAADSDQLPQLPTPHSGQSILIFSPHPDDEALGADGLIQTALQDRLPVHVAFLTCGDAFRVGVQRTFHLLTVAPSDYLRYGAMRRDETLKSLGDVGIKPYQVFFLGYPDRGLTPMWRDHWAATDPYTSWYSQCSTVPYAFAYHPGAPYSGSSLLADILSVIESTRPTDIYVTHPSDDHPDHSAASGYVTLAVQMLHRQSQPWARSIRLHYYIVHRGDWPVPQGDHEDDSLAPPAELIGRGTNWRKLPLTPAMVAAKARAIGDYKSQTQMMGRFLISFARRDEVFGDIPTVNESLPESSAQTQTSAYTQLDTQAPMALDPIGGNIFLALQPGANIAELIAAHDSENLYVRMKMNGKVPPEVRFWLYVRSFDLRGNSPDQGITLTISPRNTSPDTPRSEGDSSILWRDDSVFATIPLSALHAPADGMLFIDGESGFSDMPCDKTGPRMAHLHLSVSTPARPPSS